MTHAFSVDKKTFELLLTYDGKPLVFSIPPFASVDEATLYGDQLISVWNDPKQVGEGAIYPNFTNINEEPTDPLVIPNAPKEINSPNA
jgi:hypothetical protein